MKSIFYVSLALVLSTNAWAVPGYDGAATANAISNAAVSGNTISGGSGVQYSGASAHNVTTAGASKGMTPNGVQLTTFTTSAGATETYAGGIGDGSSGALALQGGTAEADASSRLGDGDSHNGHQYTGRGTWDFDKTSAGGGGYINIESNAAQGSIAGSANVDDGWSHQVSGAGAYNETTGYATVTPEASHEFASLDLTGGVETSGLTYTYSNGYVNNAVGGSGAIAEQDGLGTVRLGGGASVEEGNGWTHYTRYRHGNHYHYNSHPHSTTTDQGSGVAKLEVDADGGTFSVSGGFNNHGGITGAAHTASNEGLASVSFDSDGVGIVQTLDAETDSTAAAAGGALGQAFSSFDALASGRAKASGSFGGDLDEVDVAP